MSESLIDLGAMCVPDVLERLAVAHELGFESITGRGGDITNTFVVTDPADSR